MGSPLRLIGFFFVLVLAVLLIGPLVIPIPPLDDVQGVQSLADADSRFVEVGDLQMHFKESGSGSPAIVLLHGFGASEFSWREVLVPLGEHGRTIAYDRPAFGLTERLLPGEWSDRSPYGPEAQIDLLFGLMDALGVDRAVLIGHSAGGAVAAQSALDRPDRVAGLVLVDAAVFSSGGPPGLLRPLLNTPHANRLGPWFSRGIQQWGEELVRASWHDSNRVTPEILAGYRKPLQVENWDVALWELTKASRPTDLPERLDELDVPVLVIAGDDDRIVPTEESLRLAGEIPQAELVILEGCGHLPHEECPEAFLEAVERLLEREGIDG